MLEEVFPNLGVELGQHLTQRLGIEVGRQFLAVVRREEAHQVGDIGRVQGRQQLTQALGVAAIERVGHHRHIFGI